jgi:SnoaL-like domain
MASTAPEDAVTGSDVLTRMLHAIDRLDWATVRDCFTDPVHTDYTSLWGGEPATMPIDDLIAGWIEFVKGFGATQHLTGPVLASGDQIQARDQIQAHVTAHHWRPNTGQAWVVHGHYTARLAGGKIAELTLHTFHASGDASLPGIPAQREATAPGTAS